MRNAGQKIAADRFRWRPLNTSIVPPQHVDRAAVGDLHRTEDLNRRLGALSECELKSHNARTKRG